MKNGIITITSIKDPRVAFARSLHSTSNRQKQNACLLYGAQALNWALKSNWKIKTVFCTKSSLSDITVKTLIQEICLVSEGIMKKISGTSYLVPVLAVTDFPTQTKYAQIPDILLLLDAVKDHGNIGTIIRTACAFCITQVALTNMESDLFNRKTVDASRGTVFNVQTNHYQNSASAIKKLKKDGYQIVVTTPYGSKLQSELHIKKQPVVLVIGNESDGVSPEVIHLADACIQIPMQPEVESLNVGVAAGISMYEIKIKTVLAMLKEKIQSTLGREINVSSKTIMNQLELELTPVSHFSAREAIFLMQLSCDRKMSLNQISRDSGLFDKDLQIFLDHLHNNNFIQPTSNENDCWQITVTGEKWLAEIWPVVEKAEKKALLGFSENEIIQLNNFLQRIQDNCKFT